MSYRLEFLKSKIRDVADFPKPGIMFKDITPALSDAQAFRYMVDLFAEKIQSNPVFNSAQKIACMESRGFLMAAPVAYATGKSLVLIRKPKKLPYQVYRQSYDLEYGQDTVEMHVDSINPGERILMIDDVIATGGTAHATWQLIKQAKGEAVGALFLMDLTFLE